MVAPGLQPADAGEFQLVARELGIAHPPGYPLYTLAAHAFGQVVTWEPVFGWIGALAVQTQSAEPAPAFEAIAWQPDPWPWAVNLFSAVLALATLCVVGATAGRLCGPTGNDTSVPQVSPLPPSPSLSRIGGGGASASSGRSSLWPGLLAAAVLLASPTFRAQALVANIRMPTALLAALLMYLTVRWLDREDRAEGEDRGRVDRVLVAIAFVFGLAAGHHSSLVFLGLPIAAVVLIRRPRVLRDVRTLAAMAAAFAVSLIPLLYLPIRDRAGALFAPGNLTTLDGFLNHVLALGFRGDVLYIEDVGTLVDRVAVLWNILWLQFGWLLVLVAIGTVWLARARPLATGMLVASAAITAALAITYRAPQTMEYLLPTYVALAVLAGGTGGAVVDGMRRHGWDGRPVVAFGAAVIVAIAFLSLMRQSNLHQNLDRELSSTLDCAPLNGAILASWHFYAPLLYATRHANSAGYASARPDVTVTYVHPEGAEPIGETWRRRLTEQAAADPGKHVAVTNRTREMLDADLALWPVPRTPFFASGPPDYECRPDDLVDDTMDPEEVDHFDADFGDLVRLTKVNTVHPLNGPERWDVTVAFWSAHPITETLTAVVQLVDATGTVWGQVDHAIGPARWNAGGLTDRMTLVPFQGWERGNRFDLHVGVYRNTPDGPERLKVEGEDAVVVKGINFTKAPRDSNDASIGIPFGNAMTLIDHRTRRDGNELVVDLTWRADPWASRSDYTVSVQAHGDDWTAQDDGTPALGAIPTLKWLPGMVIHDRHRIRLPADLPEDAPYRVTVGVYDAFSLEPLPVTDGELVRQGQGQAVEIDRRP